MPLKIRSAISQTVFLTLLLLGAGVATVCASVSGFRWILALLPDNSEHEHAYHFGAITMFGFILFGSPIYAFACLMWGKFSSRLMNSSLDLASGLILAFLPLTLSLISWTIGIQQSLDRNLSHYALNLAFSKTTVASAAIYLTVLILVALFLKERYWLKRLIIAALPLAVGFYLWYFSINDLTMLQNSMP